MMKRLLLITACLGLIVSASGCAGSGSSLMCGFQGGPFRNGPVRTQIRSWFRGDECSTCNPPAGQPNCGTNVAPLCESCGNPYPQAPMQADPIYSGVMNQGGQLNGQLYDSPGLNGPVYGNPVVDVNGVSVQGQVGGAESVVNPDPGVLPPAGIQGQPF